MRTRIRTNDRSKSICVPLVRILVVLTTLCGIFLSPLQIIAQEPDKVPGSLPSQNLTTLLETRGSLTLRDATLTEALFLLREQWKIDMVVADNVEGNVNATFTGASLREILDSLLLSRGYGYRVLGNSIVVLPLDQLGALKPLFKSQMIPLEHADPTELLGVVELLLSPQGKALSIRSAKSIMVLDYPDRTAIIRQQIEELDAKAQAETAPTTQPTQPRVEPAPAVPTPEVSFPQPQVSQPEPFPPPAPGTNSDSSNSEPDAAESDNTVELDVRVFRPQYVTVNTLLPAIESLLSSNGRTAILEKEDQVVVADEKLQLDVIEEAVLALDRPRPQVRIWAMIYDCGLEDVERIGVNWNARFFGRALRPDGTPADQIGWSSITAVAPAMGAPNGALTLMTLGSNVEVSAVINALNTSSDSKLLADPNVVAANHEPAKIEIVTEIPYQQLTEGLEGGSIGTTAFREAGVTLEVTPHIARDDTISLAINPKFSVLAGFTENDEQPIIDRREAKTTVRVHNGETFVLGGLRQRTKIQNRSGIPYLKDRKYIGKFFRFRQDTFRESELLVFITPQIIPPTASRTPREEVAAEFSQEELDCNRRAPDVCWPCTDEDIWKSGGPRSLNQISANSSTSTEPDTRVEVPPFMEFDEPTADNSDTNQFIVRPAITGQAAASSTAIRETKLPMTMRLKNALRVPRESSPGLSGGSGFDPTAIGGPGGEAGSPGLDFNQLLNILPMSGQSEKAEAQAANKNSVRLLRFLKSKPESEVGRASIPRLQPPPTLNRSYSDQPFGRSDFSVPADSESGDTGTGRVRIDRLQNSDVPIFAD